MKNLKNKKQLIALIASFFILCSCDKEDLFKDIVGPIVVTDYVSVEPGATNSINVLSNDIRASSTDTLMLVAVKSDFKDITTSVDASEGRIVIDVASEAQTGKYVVTYEVENEEGVRSVGELYLTVAYEMPFIESYFLNFENEEYLSGIGYWSSYDAQQFEVVTAELEQGDLLFRFYVSWTFNYEIMGKEFEVKTGSEISELSPNEVVIVVVDRRELLEDKTYKKYYTKLGQSLKMFVSYGGHGFSVGYIKFEDLELKESEGSISGLIEFRETSSLIMN